MKASLTTSNTNNNANSHSGSSTSQHQHITTRKGKWFRHQGEKPSTSIVGSMLVILVSASIICSFHMIKNAVSPLTMMSSTTSLSRSTQILVLRDADLFHYGSRVKISSTSSNNNSMISTQASLMHHHPGAAVDKSGSNSSFSNVNISNDETILLKDRKSVV